MPGGRVLSSCTALITGASRGIGHGVAIRLAEAGAIVWGLGRVEAALAELASETGGSLLVADLSDDAAVWGALERLTDEVGGATRYRCERSRGFRALILRHGVGACV